jgi:Ca-activated chloride channel homolog
MASKSLLLAAAVILAQTQASPFRSHAELVRLSVTVTDREGKIVPALRVEEFAVAEDGTPRRIDQFAAEAVPVTLVVGLDLSTSMQGRRITAARRAVLALLDRLGPDDEFVVIGFNDRVFTVTDGTKDRATVTRALEAAQPYGATALYDAVDTGVRLLDRAAHKRKALLLISDGRDAVPTSLSLVEQRRLTGYRSATEAREATVLQIVRRSEALLYAIAMNARDPFGPDVPALGRLTDPTGGTTVPAASDEAAVRAAERIGDELRVQYVLGFVPDHHDGGFHHVEVTLKRCDGCRVHVRAGFIAAR